MIGKPKSNQATRAKNFRKRTLDLHGNDTDDDEEERRYKLRNIEETEAAKKLLQEKRLVSKTKSESNIPSSYSADYFQRGRDYAEKLQREHPELYKGQGTRENQREGKPTETSDAARWRQTATDEFMLERFRKRERNHVMQR